MIQRHTVLDYRHYSHHIVIRNGDQGLVLVGVSSKESLLKGPQVSVLKVFD